MHAHLLVDSSGTHHTVANTRTETFPVALPANCVHHTTVYGLSVAGPVSLNVINAAYPLQQGDRIVGFNKRGITNGDPRWWCSTHYNQNREAM